ncbi:hypothetical protein KZ829_22305 [Actinoplanes hulinensis]|uniref:Uncharacterized protein n=1 Tax=Actinoplanes hulinensis TaxID=1144547 RepID=A0ABS7B865_9ACTN|nr:hypothetical protein [Actinoplanes hulinensis]MBW6436478.1 hypothetical protein [Actinoplanes hulinensis]
MRRWYLLAAGIVAVLLAGAGIWFAQRSKAEPPVVASSCANPVAPTEQQAPVTSADAGRTLIQAPGGGELKIVETGFSQIQDGNYVSVGAVVENSSDRVAFHTRVGFRARTDKGKSALAVNQAYTVEIPIIHPGQRMVIGNVLGLGPRPRLRPGGSNPVVAEAAIDLVQTRWVPVETTASYPVVTTALDPIYPPTRNAVIYRLRTESNACGNLTRRGATLIYRDAANRIVGGVFDGQQPSERCAAGNEKTSIGPFYDEPAKADMGKSEAAVLCDVPGAGPKVTDPSPPAN